jgi:FkbM family methyltransferase
LQVQLLGVELKVPSHNKMHAGDVVLDCGANVGSFARMAAPVLGPRGTIYCIEPIPDVCTALEVNIKNYQKWAQKHKLRVADVVAVQAGGLSSRQHQQRWSRQFVT